MPNSLFPEPADNAYRGHRLALWVFAALVLFKTVMSVNCIFNGYSVATSADGLPLDTYTAAGAQAVLYSLAAWGLMQLMLCLVGIVVLVRYRTLVPLLFTVLLLEHLARRAISHFLPVAKVGAPPGFMVNLVLLALTVVGLVLSLWSGDRRAQGT